MKWNRQDEPNLHSIMKNIVIVVALVAAIALGAFGYREQKQLEKNRQQLAELEAKLKAAEDQLAEQMAAAEKAKLAEQKAKVLQQTLTETAKISETQSKQVSELQQSLSEAKTNSGGFAAILKDPAMKDMIKAQQKAVMGPMIDKNYAALFKQLNLTPEQQASVQLTTQNYTIPMFREFITIPATRKVASRIPGLHKRNKENRIHQVSIFFLETNQHDVPRNRAPDLFERLFLQR